MTVEIIKTLIMKKIEKVSVEIRAIEDISKKFSVEPQSNSAYTGLVGYRAALRDLQEEIRGTNDSTKGYFSTTE